MSFLAWARSHDTDGSGRPYKAIRGPHRAVAVACGSKLGDRFFGQWLTAYIPCRSLAELQLRLPTVPLSRRWFATARLLRPDL